MSREGGAYVGFSTIDARCFTCPLPDCMDESPRCPLNTRVRIPRKGPPMRTAEAVERALALRAKGLSFQAIADRLEVGRETARRMVIYS